MSGDLERIHAPGSIHHGFYRGTSCQASGCKASATIRRGRWAPWLCSPCDKIVYPEHEKAVQAAKAAVAASGLDRGDEAARTIFNTVHKATYDAEMRRKKYQ